ncbi:MAG: 50S ribosomal protein L29 [Candidatus Brocadiales bacterium]
MKPAEIRAKSREEIIEELKGCERELLNLRIQWQTGELKNSAQYIKTRRDIARIKTVLKELELGINKELYSTETK